jgi:nucleoid-associated protein YgaU
MSAATLATTQATTQTAQSAEAVSTRRSRRRPPIAGTTADHLPVRACSADARGPQPAEPPTLQLTRRGRTLLAAVSVLVFGAAIAVLGLRLVGVLDGRPEVAGTMQVQVGAGQTLWSVARETNPARDTAWVVDEIARLNGLHSAADIRPGQLLMVPVFR